ncbi:hypothetical protein Tco_0163882 [Tanacetum coccineum]
MLAAVHACYSIRVVSLDESRQYTILDTNVRVNFFNDNGDKIIGGHNSIELVSSKNQILNSFINFLSVTLRGGVGKRILFPIESFDRPYQSTGFSGEVPGAEPWRKFVDVARDIELIMLNVSRNWFMGQFVECLIKCPISTALLVVPGIHAPDFDKTQ